MGHPFGQYFPPPKPKCDVCAGTGQAYRLVCINCGGIGTVAASSQPRSEERGDK